MSGKVVGSPRTVLTSLDGETWAASQSVGLNRFESPPRFDILAAGGLTVVTGHDLLATSADGETWTDDDYDADPLHDPSALWSQLNYTEQGYRVLGRVGGKFVSLGYNLRAESSDGLTWQKTVLAHGIVPLAHGSGVFLGQAELLDDLRLFSSVEGQIWTESTATPPVRFDAVTVTATDAVAVAGNKIYYAATADIVPDPRPKLLNLSARGRVGTGEDLIVGGFVIGGEAPIRVLIRGVGPSLADHGVANPLVNPKLVLFNAAGEAIGNNDTWGDAANADALREAAAAVGAFPLREGSNDAAMLVTLDPGVYTAQVTSADGSLGVALQEIYEVP